jgi:hypothetical protein
MILCPFTINFAIPCFIDGREGIVKPHMGGQDELIAAHTNERNRDISHEMRKERVIRQKVI